MDINFCIFPNQTQRFLKLNETQLTHIFLPLSQHCLEVANTIKGIKEEQGKEGKNKH